MRSGAKFDYEEKQDYVAMTADKVRMVQYWVGKYSKPLGFIQYSLRMKYVNFKQAVLAV